MGANACSTEMSSSSSSSSEGRHAVVLIVVLRREVPRRGPRDELVEHGFALRVLIVVGMPARWAADVNCCSSRLVSRFSLLANPAEPGLQAFLDYVGWPLTHPILLPFSPETTDHSGGDSVKLTK